MADKLLQTFVDVNRCHCGCRGLKLTPVKGDYIYIAPHGADPGGNPEVFFRCTEVVHESLIEVLWDIRDGFIDNP